MKPLQRIYRVPQDLMRGSFAGVDEKKVLKDILQNNGEALIFIPIFLSIQEEVHGEIQKALADFREAKIGFLDISKPAKDTLQRIENIIIGKNIFDSEIVRTQIIEKVSDILSQQWMIDRLSTKKFDLSGLWKIKKAKIEDLKKLADGSDIFNPVLDGVELKTKTQLLEELAEFKHKKIKAEEFDKVRGIFLGKIYETINKLGIFSQEFLERKVIPDIEYRVSLYWILQILSEVGIKFYSHTNKRGKVTVETGHGEKAHDVETADGQAIYNILQDNVITPFLIVLKSFGIADFSENVGNEFEREKELKVLEIDKADVISRLDSFGSEKTFEGKVIDTYYDYPSLRLDKGDDEDTTSFRTREKIDLKGKKKHYYTIKRKLTDEEKEIEKKKRKNKKDQNELRDCFEKEFKINKFGIFQKILLRFGLRKSRKKVKDRISYQMAYIFEGKKVIDIKPSQLDAQGLYKGQKAHFIKFDIDTYEGIPTLMELECEHEEIVKMYINKLGLSKNKTSKKGSRWVFKNYDRYYEKFYKVIEDNRVKGGKVVIWYDDDGNEVDRIPLYSIAI